MNCYSPTEDVLGNAPVVGAGGAWSAQGGTVTNAVLDVNGAVYLVRAGGVGPEWSQGPSDLSSGYVVQGDALVVAPFWDHLFVEPGLPTCVRVGTATHDGEGYLLVECMNACRELGWSETNAISFQVAIPTNGADRAYVRHRDVLGAETDGRHAAVGFQAFDGRTRASWCCWERDRVADGLALRFLFGVGTNPLLADTDGDGLDDGTEVLKGSDPNDASDGGRAPPADSLRELTFDITGDFAAWEMTIEGLGPVDRRTLRITMGAPDRPESVPERLRKGNSYRLTMKWLNSDGHTGPPCWYCWQAKIDGQPSGQTFAVGTSGTATRNDSFRVVAGSGWVAENESGVLSAHTHTHDYSGGNIADGLSATLHVLNISVVGIKFNHTPSLSTADALTIRPNGTSVYDVSHGEWTESGRTNYPACYVGGVTPTVKVKFRVEPSESCSSLEISADVYGFALSLLRRLMCARRFADVGAEDGREVRGTRESAGERDVQQAGTGRLRHQFQGSVDAAACEKAAGRECAMPPVWHACQNRAMHCDDGFAARCML